MKLEETNFYSPGDLKIRSLAQALCRTLIISKSAPLEFEREFKNAFSKFSHSSSHLYASLTVLLKCFKREDWLDNRLKPIMLVRNILKEHRVNMIAKIFVEFRIYELHYGNRNEGVSEFILSSLGYYATANLKAIREEFIDEATKFFNKAAEEYSDHTKKMTIMFCGGKSADPRESTGSQVRRTIDTEILKVRQKLLSTY